MVDSKPIADWKKCVKMAKRKMGGKRMNTYMVIKGSLLREAQKYYCAMGY